MARRLLVLCFVCSAAAPLWAARPAHVTLGPANREAGLSVPSGGDGENEPAFVDWRPCRRVAGERSQYLYVVVDPDRFAPGDQTIYVTCDLFDDAAQLIQVQYDSASPAPDLASKYRGGPSMVLLGSGRWVRRTVRLEHARLGKGQNFGADFRLCGKVTVARIRVSDEPPRDFDPDTALPADELAKLQVNAGPGQEITFGNDCDRVAGTLFRALGVTSVESYVTWQTVEDAARGNFDWSRWDRQVEALRASGLKWVPFLVAGPAYATPKWFREGPQHFPFVCLEHNQPSKVESLWNPALRPGIEQFLSAFAQRYSASGVIESVLLGVTGIYGESIYPAGPEGGWTADIPGHYHNHAGWWAADGKAAESFRAALQQRYQSIERLNWAWGTRYGGFSDVAPFLPERAPSAAARGDFVAWYEQSMTDWSRWWVQATRRYFPRTPIYLCTGGDGTPVLGADFTAQAKAIAPFGAGIRITNEGSSYQHNFAVTREVATATRFYKTYCGFEPASGVTPDGVVARAYNATAAGAKCLHFYTNNVLGDPQAIQNWRREAPQVMLRRLSAPQVAVYLPRAAWAQDPALVGRTYQSVRSLRDLCDVDLVNATSVRDGILGGCRLLVLPTAANLEPDVVARVVDWAERGGVVAVVSEEAQSRGLFVRRHVGPAPARLRVLLGTPGDEPFLEGDWSHPENGTEFPEPGTRKRWSGARPVVWLPLRPGQPAVLELDAYTPKFALEGVGGEIRLGDEVLGKLREGHAIYRFELPAGLLRSSPLPLSFGIRGWRPSEKTGSSDQRLLGLAVSRVELTSGPGEARTNAGLEVGVDQRRLTVEPQGRGLVVLVPPLNEAQQGVLWPALLGQLLPARGVKDLADDDAVDGVFVTRQAGGRLWLNDTDQPVVKAGLTLPPHRITETR